MWLLEHVLPVHAAQQVSLQELTAVTQVRLIVYNNVQDGQPDFTPK